MLKVWFADESIGYALGAYNVFLRTDDGGDTGGHLEGRLGEMDRGTPGAVHQRAERHPLPPVVAWPVVSSTPA